VHITEEILAPLRARYGEPVRLVWEGEISEREHRLATFDPERSHDVTLFITNRDRIALIRKPHFEDGLWRTPGGGVKPGEDFVDGVVREAIEETGLHVELRRFLVDAEARFLSEPYDVPWRTLVFHAVTDDEEIAPRDVAEIAEARWGTAQELAGPIRERLLASGHALWRYRVALHDAALESLRAS
jgi:8-oxo-dGTP pyrophosphatase MutT (NUDIX family)